MVRSSGMWSVALIRELISSPFGGGPEMEAPYQQLRRRASSRRRAAELEEWLGA